MPRREAVVRVWQITGTGVGAGAGTMVAIRIHPTRLPVDEHPVTGWRRGRIREGSRRRAWRRRRWVARHNPPHFPNCWNAIHIPGAHLDRDIISVASPVRLSGRSNNHLAPVAPPVDDARFPPTSCRVVKAGLALRLRRIEIGAKIPRIRVCPALVVWIVCPASLVRRKWRGVGRWRRHGRREVVAARHIVAAELKAIHQRRSCIWGSLAAHCHTPVAADDGPIL